MLLEPRQTPHDTKFIGTTAPGQSCYKPQYLHIVNMVLCHAGFNLIDRLNMNRCTEDTYLEVKWHKEKWDIDKFVEDKPAYQSSVKTLNAALEVLELKFDEDEER